MRARRRRRPLPPASHSARVPSSRARCAQLIAQGATAQMSRAGSSHARHTDTHPHPHPAALVAALPTNTQPLYPRAHNVHGHQDPLHRRPIGEVACGSVVGTRPRSRATSSDRNVRRTRHLPVCSSAALSPLHSHRVHSAATLLLAARAAQPRLPAVPWRRRHL